MPEQKIGFPVPAWTARQRPPRTVMTGSYCRVEPVDIDRHAADLFEAQREDPDGRNWIYLSSEPPQSLDAYRQWLKAFTGDDPMMHAIVDLRSGKAIGVAAYLRVDPANGVIEVGHINYSPRLQRTVAATEAMVLMMRRVFDELGYRRYEWKCDALNEPSRRAALRLGFRFEGVFRQALVYKGRNRDTAWFSITDKEWPAVKERLGRWLDRANFDDEGNQRTSLSLPAGSIESKYARFTDQWSPKAIARMNHDLVKLSRLEGEFIWHAHTDTDELFYIVEGELRIDFRDGAVTLKAGDVYVVPKGKEHKPYAERECRVLLVEPEGVRNTGDAEASALTAPDDVWI